MKIIEVKIEDIKPYENNAREHSAKQIKLLMENIKKFGFAVPIIIDKENNIIAGHGRLIAVTKMDWKEVPCVRMENLTTKEANAMRLADNKLSEMSTWNMELVIPELKEMDMELFQMTGFDPDILLGPKSKEDDIPEDVPARAKLGDVYQLDTHRIICGDSTDETVIEKLLDGNKADMSFSDLPYNIGYEGGAGKRRKKIENDKMNTNQFSVFLENAMKILLKYTGGGIYVCMSPKEIGSLKNAFEKMGGHWSSTIIWVKNNFTLSGNDYQNTYEPILYGWAGKDSKPYFVDRRDISNVWEDISTVKHEWDGHYTTITFQGFKVKILGQIEKGSVIKKKQRVDIMRHDKPIKSELHSTMKPVSLMVEAISNSSKPGDIVLDICLGSGSTLISCEKTGRRCFGCEIDPKYIDTVITRWEQFSGKKACKV